MVAEFGEAAKQDPELMKITKKSEMMKK